MSSAVIEAKVWIGAMVQREMRGTGDLDNAMDRLARRHHLPRSVLWSLRYRPPKDIFASVYLSIKAAYEAETERQAGLLAHELEITKAKSRIGKAVVGAARTLVSSEMGTEGTDGQAR